jgi:tetratricopeptide (TPR) repeat protein
VLAEGGLPLHQKQSMSRNAKKAPGQAKTAVPSGVVAVHNRWAVLGICIFLAAIVWIVFGQTLHYEFVNYDDPLYVYRNPVVSQGLTLKGIAWAFSYGRMDNWIPLAMISHMADVQFYGLNPGGHHLTNVLLQTAASILLFLVLRQMTGALWRSAFVAAVFAIHPLRAESVAWVTERKDVLSAVFFMLTIGAYTRYARHASPARYGLVAFLFALGLMSKPMLVTLPFVLLLLDYWPLNRIDATQPVRLPPMRLILEKLPLLGLSVATSLVTILIQTKAISSFVRLSLPDRLGNALISYVVYLKQIFWPSDLAVFYPMPTGGVSFGEVILAAVILLFISISVFTMRKTRPYLLTGWLWYIVMLLPVIGIIQVGAQSRADRYTYLPQIGLYVALAWGATDVCAKWHQRRAIFASGGLIVLGALILSARAQVSYWRNSESLWNRTLACAYESSFAHNNLGNALLQEGKPDQAILHFQKALQMEPGNAKAHNNLANILVQKGDADGAIAEYQKALQIKPDNAEIHNNLADVFFQKGNADEAISHYQQALQIKPSLINAQSGLAWVLATAQQASLRNGSQALELARRANQTAGGRDPFYLRILAAAEAETGQFDEAVQDAQKAMDLAQAAGKTELVNGITTELKLYEAKLPYHQTNQ